MKVATWDIEASHLKANFGVLLCACVKPLGRPAIVLRNGRKGSNDKALLVALRDVLEKFDMLIGHYSLGFDLKFLNSRLMHYGERPLSEKYHLDMLSVARRWSCTHSRKQEAIGDFLGVGGKTKLDPEVWRSAAYDGDKKALDEIVRHCIGDVEQCEGIYMKPYMQQFCGRSIVKK